MNKAVLYELTAKPPLHISLFVSLQHLLAVFGGIITAPLIISLGMGLSVQDTSYLVSSSLVISGLATFIQISRVGPVGSGLLSIQGTSFTFIGPLISAYFVFVEGRTPEQALGIIFGTSALCAFCVGVFGQLIEKIQAVITPNVTGTTVVLIGLSLVWTTLKNVKKEISTAGQDGIQPWLILALVLCVFFTTLILSQHKNSFVRILSVTLGLLVGTLLAFSLGLVDFEKLNELEVWFIPQVNHYPLAIDFNLFLVLLPIFVISSVETIGDLTATSNLSGIRLGSKDYWKRIRGGITGDAINSVIASVTCTFPNTTFSQNNGVIRLTGVCSRYIGLYTAGFLCLLGIFPIVGGLFIVIPGAVLYGATVLMFALVLVSGIGIVREHGNVDRWSWYVLGVACACGWFLPMLFKSVEILPRALANIFSYPISTGAMVAILIELVRNICSIGHKRVDAESPS